MWVVRQLGHDLFFWNVRKTLFYYFYKRLEVV